MRWKSRLFNYLPQWKYSTWNFKNKRFVCKKMFLVVQNFVKLLKKSPTAAGIIVYLSNPFESSESLETHQWYLGPNKDLNSPTQPDGPSLSCVSQLFVHMSSITKLKFCSLEKEHSSPNNFFKAPIFRNRLSYNDKAQFSAYWANGSMVTNQGVW